MDFIVDLQWIIGGLQTQNDAYVVCCVSLCFACELQDKTMPPLSMIPDRKNRLPRPPVIEVPPSDGTESTDVDIFPPEPKAPVKNV